MNVMQKVLEKYVIRWGLKWNLWRVRLFRLEEIYLYILGFYLYYLN